MLLEPLQLHHDLKEKVTEKNLGHSMSVDPKIWKISLPFQFSMKTGYLLQLLTLNKKFNFSQLLKVNAVHRSG